MKPKQARRQAAVARTKGSLNSNRLTKNPYSWNIPDEETVCFNSVGARRRNHRHPNAPREDEPR